jgi:hypothetical protein
MAADLKLSLEYPCFFGRNGWGHIRAVSWTNRVDLCLGMVSFGLSNREFRALQEFRRRQVANGVKVKRAEQVAPDK